MVVMTPSCNMEGLEAGQQENIPPPQAGIFACIPN